MKTLVVLSALTAIAIAAPALSENRYVGYSPVSYQITPTFRREKKSATETSHNARHLSEVQQLPLMETNHVTKVSGRTFGLKKPIIVKNNKLGYHLYRNSEEEQAQIDPQEKCTKEVKVKLCDSENSEARSNDLKANSTCKTDLHNSKSDIMQSIKTAKQAVEKLQHMKHDWKHNTLGSDAELHKNIEVARLALEHIQQNFGNLETMNMQATNAEDLQDAKEERITQWMEAINNIQKNSEIARNLEDGFIASNNQAHNMDQRKSNNELDNVHNHEITIKSSSHDEQSNMDKLEAKTEHEVTHQDMKAELSETKEAKFDHKNTLIARVDMPVTATEEVSPNSSFITNSDLDKNIESEAHGKAKNSELDFNSKHPVAEDHKMPSEPKEPRAMAAAEVIKMEMDKIKQSNKAEKALESAIGTLQKSSMKSTESKADFVHHDDMNSQSKGFDEKNSKSAWMESKDNDMLAKASEHIPTAIDTKEREMKTDLTHEKAGHVSAFTAMKSVEHHKNLEKQFIEDDQNHSHIEMKSSATSLTKMPERHDDNVAMKSADQVHNNEPANLKKGISSSALRNRFDTVKMAEDLNSERHHHLHEESVFPTQIKHLPAQQMTSAKNAAAEQNLRSTDMQRVVTFGFPSHHNMMPMPHHYNQPHFPSAHHQFHHPSHDFYHNFHGDGVHFKVAHAEAQEKAANMDNTAQGALQTNMNRLSGKSAFEHNTHWKQEPVVAARGAYGSYGLAGAGVGTIGASAASLAGGSSSGPGAIGVFPHANTGESAIPLLLGCSPSVVSGSLAKAHSSYGAPAYRARENINLH